MPVLNGRNYSGVRALNVLETGGTIRFETPLITPTTTTGERLLYVDSSNNLKYDNGSSVVTLGAGGGGGGTPTWETIFAQDATFTITPDTTFTIAGNRSTATNVLTFTNIAGGSGAIVQLTNDTTSNKDINGTASAWYVLGTGVATFAGVSISGTATALATTGAAVWTLLDNSATSLAIGSAGATSMLVFDTSDASTTLKTSANTFQVTSGKTNLIQASNTISGLVVTDNTVTTFGANADSSGVVVFRSTSLTTGSLLQLQLTEGTLNGGFYLTARDVTGGANVFTIGEDGIISMLGTAGSDSLTITNGDVVVSDGSLLITDADNANSFAVVNNTATTVSVVSLDGSGVFTGNTTASFMTLMPTGLTTGTALYIAAAAATTSVAVVDIAVAGLTSGSALRIVGDTATFTTGGKLIELSSTAAVAGNLLTATTTGAYTGTGMILVTAGAATSGVLLSLISTTGLTSGSLIRATTATAGAIATSGAISFSATGNFTSTARVGFVNIKADSTTSGVITHISGAGLTDGTALAIDATEATLTTGKYIDCYDGAASDFTVGKYGATVIAGNASGTAALTVTAGDIVITSGFLVLSANAKGITFTGTGANGGVLKNLKNSAATALSGTQLDIAIDIGGTPYYFTVYPTKA